jgi:hypothetical protein
LTDEKSTFSMPGNFQQLVDHRRRQEEFGDLVGAMARSISAGSGLVTTTTVPPCDVHGTASTPAVCVIGAPRD